MGKRWIEGELRGTGDEQDKLDADEIAAMRKRRGQDILLPTAPITPEAPKLELVRFTSETKKALEREGYVVHELTGQSIASLKDQGRGFRSTWHRYPDFEALASRLSEVAINPEELFLQRSGNKTLSEQQRLIAAHSAMLSLRYPGTEAILGEAPDYIEIAFKHLDATKQYLFGKDFGFNFTRTNTRVEGGVASLGLFDPGGGWHVGSWGADVRSGGLRVAPLVVPVVES